ncbi:type II toxin-antitoxin system RelB/DinJ family antitoxin [Aerococcus sanguinicola]|uniref:Type II toxin-antitoxin system antitoxin, RelB/DinJ family n=1 Tax=Aerococcus sanguinicola TaxID=119206 RepID=A0A0X8FBY7_9LACT|nr:MULTISPECIES: type II toxin-antitoxin system RelB/DinJ family antitoxin [Aerococcus]AMB93712.1 XRE family transcriptional regulator [Aerococcus sanguinicola]MDK7050440.1 type II toxin-antitoxin system RelB/DinJ family antitoxin [Aerococcus sanguinicola]OFT94531.1 XRE family transcriptional regulator [Aerococcus sp. HMSC23C02]PKZ21557.1 type II toxin-antitoxin system antitoxin, RelB/DinJ family [Aerococcus sanguinicola]
MAKTANLYVRMDPELKEQAEYILNSLGLPPSSAFTMFYKQVVLQQGLPFDVKLSYRAPFDSHSLTKDELHKELEKGYQSILAGDVRPVEASFASLHKEFDQ